MSGSVFNTGQDEHSLPVIMKRLQNITIKRSRGTFNKMSIINKMKALNSSKKKFRAEHLFKADAASSGSTTPDVTSVLGADGEKAPKHLSIECIEHACIDYALPEKLDEASC